MNKSFSSIRKQYVKGVLRESQVDRDPVAQLDQWLQDAINAECPEPTAMVLSTSGSEGRPSARVVMLKESDRNGITFFTNYESRKGEQLQANPFAAVVFFWPRLERQVRIEGSVMRVSEAESDAYFDSRPEPSRISAAVSPQSKIIPHRDWLEDMWMKAQQSSILKRPANWGGYRLVPDYYEFWQGRADRLHDRLVYKPAAEGWKISRLAP